MSGSSSFSRVALLSLPLPCLLIGLTGCGAGSGAQGTSVATGTTSYSVQISGAAPGAGALFAEPAFHAAPVILDPPDFAAADSAIAEPHRQNVSAELAALSTRHLTVQALDRARREGIADAAAPGAASPMAAGASVVTYNPSQFRAAYGYPALTAPGTALTAAQAAQLGAGQTIYIIDAYDDPNAAAELSAFNQSFGLTSCSSKSIPAQAPLPLSPASTTGCSLSVVYATPAGGMTATQPAFNSMWATESALDVQWAHATAPLARIILIETADASLASFSGAISLANRMGPGVVSMSWGATEGGYTAAYESFFSAPNMTYVAAAGDSGAGVSWPAVSPHVIAVGGTTLTWNGSGTRSEVVWGGTGGGISQFTPAPSYQSGSLQGPLAGSFRAVSDVALNADPATGEYVAVMLPGNTTVNWLSVGGTSLGSPQWAATLAIANALRAQLQLPLVGIPHFLLYTQIGANSGTYSNAFLDITQGADGSCTTCSATAGYDLPTGLGTPNASVLFAALTDSLTPPDNSAPILSSESIAATVGQSLSFTVTVSAAHPVTYLLSGAPAGMTISKGGSVSWPSPLAGTYPVQITAQDSANGLVGQGTYTVTVSAPQPPVVQGGNIGGRASIPLSFMVTTSDTNPVTWTLSGAPSGMTVGAGGAVSWPSPRQGTYQVKAIARDTLSGLTGQGIYTVNVAQAWPPFVMTTTVNVSSLKPMSFTVFAADPNPLSFSLSGAPKGMTIASPTPVISWPSPVTGSYAVVVTATDRVTGLSGQGTYTINVIAQPGPVISTTPLSGVAGKPFTATISFKDAGGSIAGASIAGYPPGMNVAGSLSSFVLTWQAPIAGTYKAVVQATDSYGIMATMNLTITISAH